MTDQESSCEDKQIKKAAAVQTILSEVLEHSLLIDTDILEASTVHLPNGTRVQVTIGRSLWSKLGEKTYKAMQVLEPKDEGEGR